MKKILKVILAIVGLVVIVVVGFLSFYSYKSSDAYASNITKQAVEANDSSICKNIMQPFMNGGDDPIHNCNNQVAIQNKNLNACPINEWTCFGAYFAYYKTNDQTLCKVIQNSDQRDECYFEQSYVVHDIELCSLIRPNNKQSSCYINLVGAKKDGSICDKYLSGQNDKDICYERAASTLSNSWCQKIQDSTQKLTCLNVNSRK